MFFLATVSLFSTLSSASLSLGRLSFLWCLMWCLTMWYSALGPQLWGSWLWNSCSYNRSSVFMTSRLSSKFWWTIRKSSRYALIGEKPSVRFIATTTSDSLKPRLKVLKNWIQVLAWWESSCNFLPGLAQKFCNGKTIARFVLYFVWSAQ